MAINAQVIDQSPVPASVRQGGPSDANLPYVLSVNGKTGKVVLTAEDLSIPTPVQSVNGKTGNVWLDAEDVDLGTSAEIHAISNAPGMPIPSGSDLDNYQTFGSYSCESQTVAATLSNAPPFAANFRLEVISSGNSVAGHCLQIAWSNYSYNIYYRRCMAGTWTAWSRLYNTQQDYASYSITPEDINSSSLRVTRQGNWVNIEGYITLKAQSYVANTTVLFTLPSGARPSDNRFGWFHRTDASIHVVIKSNGDVVAGDAYTSTGNPYFFGNLTYSL